MATTNILGSGIRNNHGVLFHNGLNSYASALWDTVTQRESAVDEFQTGPAVGVNGVIKPYSAGTFNYRAATVQEVVLNRGVTLKLSGVSTNILRIVGSDIYHLPIASYRGDTRQNITSWNYLTNAPTYGGSRGALVKLNDMAGNAIDFEPYPTKAVPGEFVYTTGSPNPTMGDYKPTHL